MSRGTFGAVVLALGVFVAFILWTGNKLPGDLRQQIISGQQKLDDAKRHVDNGRAKVWSEASGNADVFQVGGFDSRYQQDFRTAQQDLSDAATAAAKLDVLRRQNRRSERETVQILLRQERQQADAAVSMADRTATEAQKRVDLKHNFAATVKSLELRAKDLAGANDQDLLNRVHKAEQDWPNKKADLEGRIQDVLKPEAEASGWDKQLVVLAAKPAAQLVSADYASAIQIEDAIDHAPGPVQRGELLALTHQLYTEWDDILEDLDKGHGRYREEIQHVVTTVPAPDQRGATQSSKAWRDVPESDWRAVEKDMGMAIAHKPLGHYDTEADHTPQPPEFAYMASPAEGHNQYGYWDHSGGGSFWHWLPEYLILSNLLSHHSYVPIPSYDWEHYRQAQQYGRTYYGTDASGAPKYGSHGTFTLQRYGNSRYAQNGGFSGSKYASHGTFGSNGSLAGPGSPSRSSGGALGSGGHKFGGSSGGMKFGGSRSSGHSFGRRH